MSDFSNRLQESLGKAYRIEREIGGGGMSRVFLATEVGLRRSVVVKVLSPELAEGLSAERFAREIATAAVLQHPHIVPVLATGGGDSVPWYTMPYIAGESLRARLAQSPLARADALRILRDVAMALEHAHAQGVVHRDIKPDNILLADRTAVVTDFGIAKAVNVARTMTHGAATLTSAGEMVGTPAYMAPEQAAGDDTDLRADLYAWGMVAYELLAGKHPFAERTTARQLLSAHLNEVPLPLVDIAPDIPATLSALVARCLEKEPDSRPSNAAELVEQLDGALAAVSGYATIAQRRTIPRSAVVAGAVITLSMAALALFAFSRRSPADPTVGTRRLAVISFENLGDSADAYFADGVTDAIRGKLTSLGSVEVIARASSIQYGKSGKTPAEIAKELGVRYLLTGTVRFAPSVNGARRVQVSPALVEIGSDDTAANRWDQPFNADVADIFTVQGEIAERVAQAMQIALGTAGEAKLRHDATRNPEAYDAYLRAEAAWDAGGKTDFVSLQRARPLYLKALSLDSTMAEAWGALSRINSFLFANTAPADSFKVSALFAAEQALRGDPKGVDGNRAMGLYYRAVDRDLVKAREALERAKAAAPADASVVTDLSAVLSDLGDQDGALEFLNTALLLDPRNARVFRERSRVLLRLRRYVEAREAADLGLALSASSLQLHQLRVMTDLAGGDLPAARAAVASSMRDAPRDRILAEFANFWDMGWVLVGDDERDMMALSREAFGTGVSTWLTVHAVQHAWRGDTIKSRAAADSAWPLRAAEAAAKPKDAQRRVLLGLALAHAGRREDARRAVREAIALVDATPLNKTTLVNAYVRYTAARASLAAGDRAAAFALLREALQLRYLASPAWVRLDPSWQSVVNDPVFNRLLDDAT